MGKVKALSKKATPFLTKLMTLKGSEKIKNDCVPLPLLFPYPPSPLG
jgi:hypothetical protein